MSTILLVEDSDVCQMVVKRALSSPEIEIRSAKTVAEALEQLDDKVYDLVLLDLVLPDGDGLEVLSALQSNPAIRETPVFLLTNKVDTASKVSAFTLGADDYLIKPVNPLELRARVEMRLRKLSWQKRDHEVLRRGGLTINLPMMQVRLKHVGDDQHIDLTSKEFRILAFLAQHEGRVFSRQELVRAIWGNTTHVVDRTVDSHVCGLRRKIRPFSQYVESIPGSGYRFQVKEVGT